MQDKKLIEKMEGQASDEQIAKWKLEFPAGIVSMAVPQRKHIAYFRFPTRHDVNKALEVAQSEDAKPLDGTANFGELCYIGGSDQILKNDVLFLSVAPELRGMMNPLEAIVVNL